MKKIIITLTILVPLVVLVLNIKNPQLLNLFAQLDPNSIVSIENRVKEKTTRIITKGAKPLTTTELVERKFDMKQLLEKDTNIFFKYSLPKEVKSTLNASDQSLVEEKVTLKGTLNEIIFESFDTKTSKNQFVLIQNNQKTDVFFLNPPKDIRLGSVIEITGIKIDDKIAVDNNNSFLQTQASTPKPTLNPTSKPSVIPTPTSTPIPPKTPPPTATPTPTPAPALPPIQQTKSLAIMLINFQDNRGTPWTKEQIKKDIFTSPYSLKTYYRELAINIIGINNPDGDVYGWYNLPQNVSNCNYWDWSTSAKNIAKSQGVPTDNYDYIMYIFPHEQSCPYSGGWAYIGGKESWINGSLPTDPNLNVGSMYVPIHELGHNLGTHHAQYTGCTFQNKSISLSNNCTIVEYGDSFDVMGSLTRHMSNFHLGQIGLYKDGQTITVPQGASQTVVLNTSLLSSVTPTVRVFRNSLPYLPNQYFYLEYRKSNGVFDNFSGSEPIINGVTIRLGNEYTNYTPTQLINVTPTNGYYYDPVLKVGQTFDDFVSGTKISLKELHPDNAVLSINRYQPGCYHDNPKSYTYDQYGNPGQTLVFYVSFQNIDTQGCPPSQFNITNIKLPTVSLPILPRLTSGQVSGNLGSPDIWSITPAKLSKTVAPGEYFYSNTGFLVHSPSTAKPGWYPITITLSNSAINLTGTATFYYIVQNIADVNH